MTTRALEDSAGDMSNSDLTIQDAIQFLNEQGFEVSLTPIEQMQAERQRQAKVIQLPMSA